MPGTPSHSITYYQESVAASDTDEELLAAIARHKLIVMQLAMVCGDTSTTIQFESGTTTGITPVFDLGVNGVVVLPYSPKGWFETAIGESLTATTGAGSAVALLIGYAID